MATSMEEMMLMGVFDTRNRIMRQLKEQQQLFDQTLHSSLLLKGIRPPPWLFENASNAHICCNPVAMKDDLVPGRFVSPHNWRFSSSVGFCKQRNKPDNTYFADTRYCHKDFIVDNVSTIVEGDGKKMSYSEICCQDPVIDPLLQTVAKPIEVVAAPDRSLERITRSRSRQRALERRNNEKKRQNDENKYAASIEYTGRVTRSRFSSQQAHIMKISDNTSKCQKTHEFGKVSRPSNLTNRKGSQKNEHGGQASAELLNDGSNLTRQVQGSDVFLPCVLPSSDTSEAAHFIHGTAFSIQPKELMFDDDVEDFGEKELHAGSDARILKSRSRSGGERGLCSPEESGNKRVGMEVIITTAENNQKSGVLPSSPWKDLGLVGSPADQLMERDASFSQTGPSTSEHLLNRVEVSEAPRRESAISALEQFQDKIFVKTEAFNREAANVNNKSILSSSQEGLVEGRNTPDSASVRIIEPDGSVHLQREVYIGNVAKVNEEDTFFSAQVRQVESRQSLDLASVQFKVEDGCARNITQLMSACLHIGGNALAETVASAAKEVQNESTAEVACNGVDFLDDNQKYEVPYSGKQKPTDFVDSDDVEIREVGSSCVDSTDITDMMDPLSNISHYRKESNSQYFIHSHCLSHERDDNLSHTTTPCLMAAKPHLSLDNGQFDRKKMGVIYDLSLHTEPNTDDKVRDNSQIVNENGECARNNSILGETHSSHSYQVYNSHPGGGINGVDINQLVEQSEIDGCESLPLLQRIYLPTSVPQGKHDLEKDQSSVTPASKKISLGSSHGSQNGEQGKSKLLLADNKGSGTHSCELHRNCKYSALKDRELKFEGTSSEVKIADDSAVEKAIPLGPQMGQMSDVSRDMEERESSCQEKKLGSSSCQSIETSPRETHDQCDRCSSPFSVDKSQPVFEGFNVCDPTGNGQSPVIGVSKLYDNLDFSSFRKTAVSGLQTCKSTSSLTPLLNASTKHKLYSTPDICQSLPNGFLLHMDLKSSFQHIDADPKTMGIGAYRKDSFHDICNIVDWELMKDSSSKGCYSDFRIGSGIRSPAASTPSTGKFSERTLLKSSGSSSGKQLLKNPELTCFRIEEETNINEDNENVDADEISQTSLKYMSSEMKMLDSHEAFADVRISYNDPSDGNAADQKFLDRNYANSTNGRVPFVAEEVGVVQDHGDQKRYTTDDKENYDPSLCSNRSEKDSRFLHKTISKPNLSGNVGRANGSQSIIEKDKKPNNIVTNISSFIPLIQQKKPVAAKRDIKVKALEMAENAKRLEERKEFERKMRKEAAKVEREKVMLENLKQMEEQRKREEEKKQKKLADAARKRRKEDEEKKEKEKKRKLMEESRKQFRLQEEKLQTEKEEKELWRKVMDEKEGDKRKKFGKEAKLLKIEKGREEIGQLKVTCSEAGYSGPNDGRQPDIVCEHSQAKDVLIASEKVSTISNSLACDEGCSSISEDELQYDMSPYRGSDDDDEEEDDLAQRKFIPLWARKENLIPVLSGQQHIDPDGIFLSTRGCNVDEVLGRDNFSKYRDRNGRSDSGYWLNDSFTQQEEYQYKVKMGYIKL